MSATTWTPAALASEARPWDGSGWRAVEAQHRVASMRLAGGSLADQVLLEDILERHKPPSPAGTAGLHWLLATPFRYVPPAAGSRFRAPVDPGVFYGAEDRQTACAESGYWRWRFWQASAGLRERTGHVELTLFNWRGRTGRALDLGCPPLDRDRAAWESKDDYTATQSLARAARGAGLEVLRYRSVRHPGGRCIAVLTPAVFRAVPEPLGPGTETWTLTLCPDPRVVWQRHLHDEAWEFRF